MSQDRLFKTSHLVFALIACIAIIVYYDVFLSARKIEDQNHVTQARRKALDPSAIAQNETVTSDQTGYAKKSDIRLVEQYTQEIEQPIFKAIQDLEIKGRRLISDRKFGESQFITFEIPAFESDQIARLHGLITMGVENLPKETRQWATEMALKYVAKYTSYPAQYKFIQIVAPEDQNKKSQLFEFYTDDHNSGIPNADGVLVMDLGVAKSVRHDQKFGDSASWGTQRYGHLVEIADRSGAEIKTPSR